MNCEFHHVEPILPTLLLVLYCAYAGQMVYFWLLAKRQNAHLKASMAMFAPVIVFVLCGLAHESQLLPANQSSHTVKTWLYVFLIGATVWLVGSMQAKILVNHIYRD